MQKINKIIYKSDSKEEYLPGYSKAFPCISSYVELDKYPERFVPWHWHETFELFYVKSGIVECHTPHQQLLFPAGSGGFVNSNVLHMTKLQPNIYENIQFVHLFDALLISGEKGSLIEQKYVLPVLSNPQMEILAFFPDCPAHQAILQTMQSSFLLEEHSYGYELKLREKLSEIWLMLFAIMQKSECSYPSILKSNEAIKQMMCYVQKHYAEKISIKQLADCAFLSERACYRVFQECLHMTPAMYIQSHRLYLACQLLSEGRKSLAEISHACGFGSSSYFGKIFKTQIGCTPLEYRKKWQNNTK